jgi:uncharacterized protein YecE (DUF72 family)
MKPVHVGCSGWNYDDLRGVVYPEGLGRGSWLSRYAELFSTVEVNSTFYRLASAKAVESWVAQTPPEFIFSVKASRYLTHVRRLRDIGAGVQRFYEPLAALRESGKLGPTLWQLPANFRRDDERLRAALASLPTGRHCFEFRHPSWFDDEVLDLLRERGVALVIGDHPERDFQRREMTTDWTFVRFHQGRRGRNGNYSISELGLWKRRIAAWRSRLEVFAYCNNDRAGFYAVRNARWLAQHLAPG